MQQNRYNNRTCSDFIVNVQDGGLGSDLGQCAELLKLRLSLESNIYLVNVDKKHHTAGRLSKHSSDRHRYIFIEQN